MNPDATQLAWGVFLAGFVPAFALALAGTIVLARRAFAVKKRLDAYRTFPIVMTLSTAEPTIARATSGALGLTLLAGRARRAFAALRDSRARMAASASQARGLFARAEQP